MLVVAVVRLGKEMVELVELVVEAMDHQVGRVNLLQLLKQLLNYFDTVDCEEPCGHLYVERRRSDLLTDLGTLELLRQRQTKPLTPVFILDGGDGGSSCGTGTSFVIRDLADITSDK